MNRLIFISVLCGFATVPGFAMVPVSAIAQTSPTPFRPTPEETEELPPTENAGSADLVTQPARSTSAALEPVGDLDPSTLREIQFEVYDIRLIEGFDLGGPGPANADHVQLVIEE